MPANGKSMKKRKYIAALLLMPFYAMAQQDTSSQPIGLQEVVVKEIKPSLQKPITFSRIDKKQLRQIYYGADVPTVLQQLPAVNAYSDNGTGIGYSFFRMRGIDQTRINTTINGIPINDPENQGVFFNNFADLLSGTDAVEVQRGLGTSTNGVAAFGGSVQMQTTQVKQSFETDINLGFGSFGSSRVSVGVQSGLINQKWMSYIKLGQVRTNGFRNNSSAQIESYQLSVVRLLKKGSLHFNAFGGFAKSELAYLGIDKSTFDANKKSNPFVNGESDAFQQFFNQLQYYVALNSKSTLQASAYFIKGAAPKFQFLFPESWGYGYDFFNMPPYISGSDTSLTSGDMMSSYRLDQKFYGAFVTHTYKTNRLELNSGVHANYFSADHFMEIMSGSRIPAGIKPNHEVYRNTGIKQEASAFIKGQVALNSKLKIFADLQARTTSFSYLDQPMAIRPSYGKVEDMNWIFVNPRVGLNLEVAQGHMLYAFSGLGYREPTRFDYLQDDFAPRNIKQNEINPEQVWDTEVGYRLSGTHKLFINAYAMEFSNQIVGTGAVNSFGYAVTGNVGRSWRRGLEVEYAFQLDKMWSLYGSSAFSNNGVKSFTQTFNPFDPAPVVVTYNNTSLALSPEQIHLIGTAFESLDHNWEAAVQLRYVSKQYLDNTENEALSLPSFYTIDTRFSYRFALENNKHQLRLSFRVNNLLNANYAPSGSLGGSNTIDSQGNRGHSALFLPAAGMNYFLTLSLQFRDR